MRTLIHKPSINGILTAILIGLFTPASSHAGEVAAWGLNISGQTTLPNGLDDVNAIATGGGHSLVLRNDGSVLAWGGNLYGQSSVPSNLTNVLAIAAGLSHSMALREDSTIVVWGGIGYDYGQTKIPPGLTEVRAISAGEAHGLALRADGTVVSWGYLASVPSGLGPVAAIAAGSYHNLALKLDGTVVGWGYNYYGATSVPAGVTNVSAIAAGQYHSLALKADGTVIGWGRNTYGETDVPAGLSNVVAISAGWRHSLALQADGRVVGWGNNDWGQAGAPTGLSGVTAIAAGGYHNLALGSQGPPLITDQPSSQFADLDTHAIFAVAATGDDPLGYQWYRDGAALMDGNGVAGATSLVMTLTNLQFSDAGTYAAVVNNRFGSVQSTGAVLTVIGPPDITQQPTDRTVTAGTSASLSVTAIGTPPLSFQWFQANDPIAGAAGSTLMLSNVQPEQAGSYFVVVSNAYGSLTSSNALLTVDTFPVLITMQPVDQVAREGRSASFRVEAAGAPLNYQWFFEDTALPGQHNSVLALSHVSSNHAGVYYVTVSNVHGLIQSSNATLTVFPPSPCVPVPSNAIAWWPGESDTWDVIGGFDGSFGPKPPPAALSLYTNGLVGSAFRFTQGRFVTVPASAGLDLDKGEGFTFETWMNPERTSSLGMFGWGISQVRLQIGRSGLLEAYLVKASGQTILLQSAPANVEAAVWQHVALTCNTTNGEAMLYLNGSTVAQTNIGPGALRTTGAFHIGSADGRGYFLGLLDEPALYSRALSQGEIQSIYLADSAGKCPPPTPPTCTPSPSDVVAWWPGEMNTWDVAGGLHTSFGPQAPASTLTYGNGLVGTAFRFASSWQLTVPPAPELDLGQGDGFTFETWLNPDPGFSIYGIMGWGGVLTGQPGPPVLPGVRMMLVGSGVLQAIIVKTNGQAVLLQSPLGAVVTQSWQHVALTCSSGGDATLYVNGSAVASISGVATGLRTAGPFSLGSIIAPNGPRFSGLLDEPTLYSRALAQSEIRSIYKARHLGKCPLPPTNCQVPEVDIAGWWRGELSPLDSVSTNHGVMQPNITTPQFYTNGVSGTAFALRYRNYVMVPASASLDVGSGPGLTIEAWVNPSFTSVYPIAEWNSGMGTQGVYLAYSLSRGPAYIEANLLDDQGQSHLLMSPFISPIANQWRHVAVTYDRTSGSAALFVDGSAVTQTNLGMFTPRTTGNLYLGYRPPGNYPGSGSRFNGFMDEVTVYRRALSAAEIRCLIVNGEAGKYAPLAECVTPAPGLFAWWRGESNLWDSVSSNHGQPRATITYTNGRLGKAMVTGNPGYMLVYGAPNANVAAGAGLTVEGWINPVQSSSGTVLTWWYPRDGVRLELGAQGAGSLRANLRDTNRFSHFLTSMPGVVQTGRWQHVAVTYDRATGWGSLYLNGSPLVSANLGFFTPQASGTMALGNGFNGALDELAIYQRALSSFEIAAIYRSANGRCTEPPMIVKQPQSLRVNAGSDVTFGVEAVGNPLLRYQWQRGPLGNHQVVKDAPNTNSVLTLTNVQDRDEGIYWVQVTNAFGSVISSNAILLVNYPSVADASATRTPLILPPCTNAMIGVLDGARSADPDQDLLDYRWFAAGAAAPMATGAIAVVTLPAGAHVFDLVVDDGLLADTNRITVEVVPVGEALLRLIDVVNDSRWDKKRPLLASLNAALGSLTKGTLTPAANQLEAFQNKVRAQGAPSDMDSAATLNADAQAIIDAIGDCTMRPGQTRGHLKSYQSNGTPKMQFEGTAGKTYIIEASTDMVNWKWIGTAKHTGNGLFEFEDLHADPFPCRFYRVVTP